MGLKLHGAIYCKAATTLRAGAARRSMQHKLERRASASAATAGRKSRGNRSTFS
jgi:hypothetical protein